MELTTSSGNVPAKRIVIIESPDSDTSFISPYTFWVTVYFKNWKKALETLDRKKKIPTHKKTVPIDMYICTFYCACACVCVCV